MTMTEFLKCLTNDLWNASIPYFIPVIAFLIAFLAKNQLAKIAAQIKHEYDCRIEKLRTSNKREEQIHDVQFRYEFETYKELWTLLCKWRKAYRFYSQSIPGKKLSGPDAAFEDCQKASEELDNLFQTLESYRPFLASTILIVFDKIMAKYDTELYQQLILKNRGDYNTEFFEKNRTTLREVDEMIFKQLFKEIRYRIGLDTPT